MVKKKSVLFLVPYPLHRAPSQRFRVELFFPVLQDNQINFRVQPFLSESTWKVLYQNGSSLQKAWGVIKGFLRRTRDVLFLAPRYDYIFIHREASPIGPPIFEFIVSKIWRKKIIYDFDDAIWIPNTTQENKIVSWLKAFWKVKHICKWSHTVVGGNKYLCNFANQYNSNAILIPTCVDAMRHRNNAEITKGAKVTIGWTGSHSTMQYLDRIVHVLEGLNKQYGTETIIISNKEPEFHLTGLQFLKWKESTEVEDLSRIDIGIMPLENDPWCEGKCGFKLIQYMALGIPSIASPVGVNKEIVDDGINGFLCNSNEEWYDALSKLIKDKHMRASMGANGRKKIVEYYSIQANTGVFLNLFS